MTESEYRKNWNEKGYSFSTGSITLEKGVDQASHENKDELVVVVNGLIEFTVDDDTFTANCDTEIYIPAKAIHSISNIGSEVSVIYFGYRLTN